MTLRAIDDPSDELALVIVALRLDAVTTTPEYHAETTAADIRKPPPESLPPDHPVPEAMRYLGAARVPTCDPERPAGAHRA